MLVPALTEEQPLTSSDAVVTIPCWKASKIPSSRSGEMPKSSAVTMSLTCNSLIVVSQSDLFGPRENKVRIQYAELADEPQRFDS